MARAINKVLAEYRDRGDVVDVALGEDGLCRTLFAAIREEDRGTPFMEVFLAQAAAVSRDRLDGIVPAA